MEVLLRELREGPDGIPEYHDTEISANELSIGSAANQNIQLLGRRVAAQQAVIRKAGSRLELACKTGKVTVNARKVVSTRLSVGDVINIAGHELKIVNAPGGFDVAIELRPNQDISASEFEGAFRTDLLQTWMSKRLTAWVTVLLVVLVGLLTPLIAVKMHRADKPAPTVLPSDAFWSSGPLSAAHRQATGERCDSCHQQLFQRVPDQACLKCHQTIHDHVTPEHLALTQLEPAPRCATCHREHNEPESYLVNSGDSLCVDCHAHSRERFAKLDVEPVTGFSKQHHPEFKAHLLKPKATRDGDSIVFDWITEIKTIGAASEQSNLKFSHTQHLDPDRVLRRSDSKQLNCADCHKLEQDSEHFEPIAMETRCASCHELTFDPGAPDRQLPHGKPREAILILQDYFTRKFSDPRGSQPVRERRRLPGHEDEVEQTCSGAPFDCAMRSARVEIENQFSRRGCIGCHVVVDTHSEVLLERFQVYPIKLARDYLPAGHFDHRSHQIQGKLTGDDACLSCHKAKQSKESSDLMLPVMAKCEECHGDKPAVDRVQVQCVSCHAYHPTATRRRLVASSEGEKK
jgi:predicted CXXCH cytochrome family protein